ncbi:MAG: hypothetical protein RLZZ618_3054, partial [Pseudomonadota bacterium]
VWNSLRSLRSLRSDNHAKHDSKRFAPPSKTGRLSRRSMAADTSQSNTSNTSNTGPLRFGWRAPAARLLDLPSELSWGSVAREGRLAVGPHVRAPTSEVGTKGR